MKINKVQNTNITFNGDAKRFVSPIVRDNAKKLLDKMNKCTQYAENQAGTCFSSNMLVSISVEPKIKFADNRYLVYPVEKPDKYSGFCSFSIGDNFIQIDSKTGEIVQYKKSFFRTLYSICSRAERSIDYMLKNFDNNENVKKGFIKIGGLTQKGFQKIDEIQNKFFYKK